MMQRDHSDRGGRNELSLVANFETVVFYLSYPLMPVCLAAVAND